MEQILPRGTAGTCPDQIGARQGGNGACETDALLPASGSAEKEESASRDFSMGAMYAFFTALCFVGMSSCAKFAGREQITPYTSNEVTSVVGSILLAVIILVQKKSFIPEGLPAWKSWFLGYGVALWFFMWGSFRSLQLMDMASWTAMTSAFNQGFIMILAAIFLSEVIDRFKIAALIRNAIVIALIIKPPFIFGGNSLKVSVAGMLFLLVQTTGAAVGAVVQRRLSEHPVEPLLFWGFLANVVYWLPPGASPPEARVPFLWPTTPNDHAKLDIMKMLYPILAGFFEVMWYVFVGYGLKYMKAATFFFIMVPCQLALSCLSSAAVFHEKIDALSGVALLMIAGGFMLDQWRETKARPPRA
eukprot:TRINITY_DN3536_c0_g2_i1.p1 TRINITY_DN3536_c0_g2~~TRINITY_DN3536_c0_g2_i1.p1  ORF type:complete len:384 (-),score=31.31 TRINITY_DN3536_c0_g2_i1:206-1285(-)